MRTRGKVAKTTCIRILKYRWSFLFLTRTIRWRESVRSLPRSQGYRGDRRRQRLDRWYQGNRRTFRREGDQLRGSARSRCRPKHLRQRSPGRRSCCSSTGKLIRSSRRLGKGRMLP
ncbi:hypothetical protein ERIC1_2c04850 [Paenibacillus larvae subsp. larvae DSM 25719]|nr:hypothetical protein ERIC1_2c04850 [Paenibacillus larvae subsp. larvae DSM 25719]